VIASPVKEKTGKGEKGGIQGKRGGGAQKGFIDPEESGKTPVTNAVGKRESTGVSK